MKATLNCMVSSDEKRKALAEIKRLVALEVEQYNKQVQLAVEKLTNQLHEMYPEMQGRTLEEFGLTPVITFNGNEIIASIKPI